MDLLDELQTRAVCGDGAIGTLFLEQGVPLERCFEEQSVSDPDRVRAIHEQYIAAGARVVETNTFGANAVRLERFGFEKCVTEINRAGAQLARRAARNRDVAVAGSVGPLGITEDEARERGIDRAECFREQITALLEGGAELLFFETFMDFDEMALAFRVKQEVGDQLAICSFACAADGRLASGMPVAEAFGKLRTEGAQIVGINCMNAPQEMVQLLERMPAESLLAVYPNAGYPRYHDGCVIYHNAPEIFAQFAREMMTRGPCLIGACCGTTPAHIRAISGVLARPDVVVKSPP